MNRRIIIPIIFSFIIFHFLSGHVRAEVVTQNFTLSPGWNAVFLEVEPQSTDPAVVFAGLTDLISVWAWNPRTGTVEFIQNPSLMVPEGPQMMVYFPPDPVTPSQPNILTNLHAIHGERGYLIKMGGTADVSWTVRGHPAIPDIDWKPNSFNLVGFHLEKGNEPFFIDFFSNSPAHAGQEIYVLRNDAWMRVTDPTVRMKHGEAFWIFCKGSSEFLGPVSVQLDIGTGLPFGTSLDEQEIRIINSSALLKTVSLGISSGTWLYYWVFDPQNNVAGWQPFPPLLPLTVPANDSRTLRLAVRRAALTSGASYEANVEFTDGEGVRILLPSSVTGIDFAGLWVGDAMITKVSEPRINNTPVATGSEFSLRLIVHVNNTGQVRLLNEVIQMWQEGTGGQPGKFVLLGDDSLISGYTGAAMRDGRLVGRRISSAAFPMTSAITLSGSFGEGGSLSTNLPLPKDDPSNPFLHKYHPDHRVKDKDGNIIAGQSYEVTREITMEFTDTDSQGRPISGVPKLSWGSSDIGGIYKEKITGLHKPGNPIYIEGTFWLHKVSNVSTLE